MLQEAAATAAAGDGENTSGVEEARTLRVVNMLIQMQKLAELNVGLRHVSLLRRCGEFLPRDEMLSAVYAVVVCPFVRPSVFVCHTPVLYQNG